MNKIQRFYDVAGIVALRKVELFNRIWFKIDENVPDSDYKNTIKEILTEIIADLDNELFIGENERVNRKINPELTIDNLHLDDKKIIERMNGEYRIRARKTS